MPQPPSTVWEYLTNSDLIAQWLMPNDFQPIIGHHFMFRTRPVREMDFDGNVYCQVLEILPLKKLVYSWKFGPEPGKINLDSLVTWTLASKDRGTELNLVHSGLRDPEDAFAFRTMYEGWDENIKIKMQDLIIKHQAKETER